MVTATLENKTIPRGNDYWHSTDQIFFTMGHGYGVDPEGNTIWLGTESDILSFLDGGIMPGNIGLPAISELYRIKTIKERLDKENGKNTINRISTRQFRTAKVRYQRNRPDAFTKHRTDNIKRFKV